MKKFGILMMLAMVATPALADFWTNCTNNGGTIITANSYGNDKGGKCHDPNDPNLSNNCNGKRFCRIGNDTNWWSAFTWCESIGGKFASFESLCPGEQAATIRSSDVCANFIGVYTSSIKSNMGWNNGYLSINAGQSTQQFPRDSSHGGYGRAFCEEK